MVPISSAAASARTSQQAKGRTNSAPRAVAAGLREHGGVRGGRLDHAGSAPVESRVTSELPSTSGIAARLAGRSGGSGAGDVDGGDGRLAACEDPVLHVLDVEPGLAQQLQHPGQHADLVEVAHGEGGAAQTARCEVDAVARLARGERVDDLHDARGDGGLGLLGGGADVVGGHDPGVLGERRVPLGGAGARLVGEHVETCADAACVERREQRRLVDHVTARGVHQDRARLHRGQELGVHEVLGLRRRRDVQAHHVGGGEQLRQRGVARRRPARPAGRGWRRLRPGRSRQPIRIPNPAARSATARPIEPRPTMPRVLPSSPLALLYVAFAQRPCRASATLSAILRSRARIKPMVSSATATALRPGTLQTNTPCAGRRPRCRWCWCPHRPGSPGRACRRPRTPRGRPSCCGPPARRRRRSDRAVPRWSARAPPKQRWPRDSSSAMVWSATESANSRCMGGTPFTTSWIGSRTPGRAVALARVEAYVGDTVLVARCGGFRPRYHVPVSTGGGTGWGREQHRSQRKTTVRSPLSSTRCSQCQRTARARRDRLRVPADGRESAGVEGVVDPDDLLLDDRALVEVGGDVVGGGADQLHARGRTPGGRAWRP